MVVNLRITINRKQSQTKTIAIISLNYIQNIYRVKQICIKLYNKRIIIIKMSRDNAKAFIKQKNLSFIQKLFEIDEWYDKLNKPSITPPKWAFPVVWSILYIVIGVSLYLYLEKTNWTFTIPLVFFSLQMILNLSWTPLFFVAQMITFAMFECFAMSIFILLNIIYFHRESPAASYLLIPYLLWVFVATYLNIYVVIYNDDQYLEPEMPPNYNLNPKQQ